MVSDFTVSIRYLHVSFIYFRDICMSCFLWIRMDKQNIYAKVLWKQGAHVGPYRSTGWLLEQDQSQTKTQGHKITNDLCLYNDSYSRIWYLISLMILCKLFQIDTYLTLRNKIKVNSFSIHLRFLLD